MDINLNKTSFFCLKFIVLCTLHHKKYFNSASNPNHYLFTFRLWLYLDPTSTVQASTDLAMVPQDSTPYRDLTTTFSVTYKTDLTTTAMQQPSLANDEGTKYYLTSISPQTTETWSQITQGNEDETSYTFDWTQFDTSISEAASTTQDISLSATGSINLITTDKDIVPFNKPDSVTKETHPEISDTVVDVLTSDSTILTTVDFIDDSMVLNATQDSTDVNNTQPDESSDGHKDGDLFFSSLMLC